MKRKISSSGLADAIRELKEAKLPDLKERWRALYQSEPPHRIRRNLLIRALAYRMQEQALGGLTPTIRRLLARSPPMPRRARLSRYHGNSLSSRELS